ncbi:hypothetical protein TYRP_010566, partial [Tyrophagus putrescentiae]
IPDDRHESRDRNCVSNLDSRDSSSYLKSRNISYHDDESPSYSSRNRSSRESSVSSRASYVGNATSSSSGTRNVSSSTGINNHPDTEGHEPAVNASSSHHGTSSASYQNMPESNLQDGLFHEYKKYGSIVSVKFYDEGVNRHAIVVFRKPEQAEKALIESKNKQFFGNQIDAVLYIDPTAEPNEENEPTTTLTSHKFAVDPSEIDEYHPRATRTLFVGNLDKDISKSDLTNKFNQFGEILEIDIKSTQHTPYAFIQFTDISSVVKAMRKYDGELMGSTRLKCGFGKSFPSSCVWLCDNKDDSKDRAFTDRDKVHTQLNRYGNIKNSISSADRKSWLIFFDTCDEARKAIEELHNKPINGRKVMVDFASRDFQNFFIGKHSVKSEDATHRASRSSTSSWTGNNSTGSLDYEDRGSYESSRSRSLYHHHQSSSRSSSSSIPSQLLRSNSGTSSSYSASRQRSQSPSSSPATLSTFSRFSSSSGNGKSSKYDYHHESSSRTSSRPYRYENEDIDDVGEDSHLSSSSKRESSSSSRYRSHHISENYISENSPKVRRDSSPYGPYGNSSSKSDADGFASSSRSARSSNLEDIKGHEDGSHGSLRRLNSHKTYHKSGRDSPPLPPTHSSFRKSGLASSGSSTSSNSRSPVRDSKATSYYLDRTSISPVTSPRASGHSFHDGDTQHELSLHSVSKLDNSIGSWRRKSTEDRDSAHYRDYPSGEVPPRSRIQEPISESNDGLFAGTSSTREHSREYYRSRESALHRTNSSPSASLTYQNRSETLKRKHSTLESDDDSVLGTVQERKKRLMACIEPTLAPAGSSTIIINNNNISASSSVSASQTAPVPPTTPLKSTTLVEPPRLCPSKSLDAVEVNGLRLKQRDAIPPVSVDTLKRRSSSSSSSSSLIPNSLVASTGNNGTREGKLVTVLASTALPERVVIMISANLKHWMTCHHPPSSDAPTHMMLYKVPLFLKEFWSNPPKNDNSSLSNSSSVVPPSSNTLLTTATSTTTTTPISSATPSIVMPGNHISIPPFTPTSTSPKSCNTIMSPLGSHSPVPKSRLSRDRLSTDTNSIDSKRPNDLDDVSDPDDVSPLRTSSLDDQIKALDEKIASSAVMTSFSSMRMEKTPTIDYSKYNIKKKSQSSTNNSSTVQLNNSTESESSEIFKNLLSKSSAFDQDAKRLEHINESRKDNDLESVMLSPKTKTAPNLFRSAKPISSSGSKHESSASLINQISSSKSSATEKATNEESSLSGSTSTATPGTPNSAPVRSASNSMFPQFHRSSSIPTTTNASNSTTTTTTTSSLSRNAFPSNKKESSHSTSNSTATASGKSSDGKSKTDLGSSSKSVMTSKEVSKKDSNQPVAASSAKHEATAASSRKDSITKHSAQKPDFFKTHKSESSSKPEIPASRKEHKHSGESDHTSNHVDSDHHREKSSGAEHSKHSNKDRDHKDDHKDHKSKSSDASSSHKSEKHKEKSNDGHSSLSNHSSKDKEKIERKMEKNLLKEKEKKKREKEKQREKDLKESGGSKDKNKELLRQKAPERSDKKSNEKDKEKSRDKDRSSEKDKKKKYKKQKDFSMDDDLRAILMSIADSEEPYYFSMYDKLLELSDSSENELKRAAAASSLKKKNNNKIIKKDKERPSDIGSPVKEKQVDKPDMHEKLTKEQEKERELQKIKKMKAERKEKEREAEVKRDIRADKEKEKEREKRPRSDDEAHSKMLQMAKRKKKKIKEKQLLKEKRLFGYNKDDGKSRTSEQVATSKRVCFHLKTDPGDRSPTKNNAYLSSKIQKQHSHSKKEEESKDLNRKRKKSSKNKDREKSRKDSESSDSKKSSDKKDKDYRSSLLDSSSNDGEAILISPTRTSQPPPKTDFKSLLLPSSTSVNTTAIQLKVTTPPKTPEAVSSSRSSSYTEDLGLVHRTCDDGSSSDSRLDEELINDAKKLEEWMNNDAKNNDSYDSNLSGSSSPLNSSSKPLRQTDLSLLPQLVPTFSTECSTLDSNNIPTFFTPASQRCYDEEAAIQSLKLQKELESKDAHEHHHHQIKPKTFESMPPFPLFAGNLEEQQSVDEPATSFTRNVLKVPSEDGATSLIPAETECSTSKAISPQVEVDNQRKTEDDLAVAALLQDMEEPSHAESGAHDRSSIDQTHSEEIVPSFMNIFSSRSSSDGHRTESLLTTPSSQAIVVSNSANVLPSIIGAPDITVDENELSAALRKIEMPCPQTEHKDQPIKDAPELMFNDEDDDEQSLTIVDENIEKSLADDSELRPPSQTEIKKPLISTIGMTPTFGNLKPFGFEPSICLPKPSTASIADIIKDSIKDSLKENAKLVDPLKVDPFKSEEVVVKPLERSEKRTIDLHMSMPILTSFVDHKNQSETISIKERTRSTDSDKSEPMKSPFANFLSPRSVHSDVSLPEKKSTSPVITNELSFTDVLSAQLAEDKRDSCSESVISDKTEIEEESVSELFNESVMKASTSDLPTVTIEETTVPPPPPPASTISETKSTSVKLVSEESEPECESVPPKSKRGRKPKNRKLSDTSLHSPRSDGDLETHSQMASLSINTSNLTCSSGNLLLSPTSNSNTSSTTTTSDISPGSQGKRGAAKLQLQQQQQQLSYGIRRSVRSAAAAATVANSNTVLDLDDADLSLDEPPTSQATKEQEQVEEDAGGVKKSKRGRKKKNLGNVVEHIKILEDDKSKKDKQLHVLNSTSSGEVRPNKPASNFDVFEFRESDEDEPVPLNTHFLTSEDKRHSEPPPMQQQHQTTFESCISPNKTAALPSEITISAASAVQPALEASAGATSGILGDNTSPVTGKEYVSEMNQHGKHGGMKMIIRLKDGQEDFTGAMEPTAGKTAKNLHIEDSKSNDGMSNSSGTAGSILSDSTNSIKGVRKSARLMSQVPKTTIEDTIEDVIKTKADEKANASKRITRSYRKSDDTVSASHASGDMSEESDDPKNSATRPYRVTRSRGVAATDGPEGSASTSSLEGTVSQQPRSVGHITPVTSPLPAARTPKKSTDSMEHTELLIPPQAQTPTAPGEGVLSASASSEECEIIERQQSSLSEEGSAQAVALPKMASSSPTSSRIGAEYVEPPPSSVIHSTGNVEQVTTTSIQSAGAAVSAVNTTVTAISAAVTSSLSPSVVSVSTMAATVAPPSTPQPVFSNSAITSPTYILQDIPNISERIHHSSTALKLKTGKGYFFEATSSMPISTSSVSTPLESPAISSITPVTPSLISPPASSASPKAVEINPVSVAPILPSVSPITGSQSITIKAKTQPPVGPSMTQLVTPPEMWPASTISKAPVCTVPSTISTSVHTPSPFSESSIDSAGIVQPPLAHVSKLTVTPPALANDAAALGGVVTTHQPTVALSTAPINALSTPIGKSTATSKPPPSNLGQPQAPLLPPEIAAHFGAFPPHLMPPNPHQLAQEYMANAAASQQHLNIMQQKQQQVQAQQAASGSRPLKSTDSRSSPGFVSPAPPPHLVPPPTELQQQQAAFAAAGLPSHHRPPVTSATGQPPVLPPRSGFTGLSPELLAQQRIYASICSQLPQELRQNGPSALSRHPLQPISREHHMVEPAFHLDPSAMPPPIGQRNMNFPGGMHLHYPFTGMPQPDRYVSPEATLMQSLYGMGGQGPVPVHNFAGGAPNPTDLSKPGANQTSTTPEPMKRSTAPKAAQAEAAYLSQMHRQMTSPSGIPTTYRKDLPTVQEPSAELIRSQMAAMAPGGGALPMTMPAQMSQQQPPLSRTSSTVGPPPHPHLSRPSESPIAEQTLVSRPPTADIDPHIVAGLSLDAPAMKTLRNEQPQVQPVPQVQPPPANVGSAPSSSNESIVTKYPILWSGLLALKNDSVSVQMHFVSGNREISRRALPQFSEINMQPLRITQRMRLDQVQLSALERKIQANEDFCILLALPCGRDNNDVLVQSNNLKLFFINYMQSKQAAGIVNTNDQTCSYITHIIPSCQFSDEHLVGAAPDLMHSLAGISQLMVVITANQGTGPTPPGF